MGSNCCSGEFQTPVPTYLFEGEDRKTSFAVPSENGRLKDFDGADSPIRAVQSKGRLKEFSFNATDVENMQMVANWQVEMQVKLKLEAPDLAETTALLQDVALDPSSKALCHKQTPLQPNLHCAVNGRAVSQQGEACHQEVDHEQLEKPGDGAGDAETTGELESKEANRGPWHKSLPPGAAAPEPVDNAALEKPQASHSSFQSELHRSGLISVLEDLAPLFPQPVEDEAAEAAEDDGIMEDVCSTGMQLIDAKPILEDVCSTGMQGTPDDSQDIEEAQHTPSDVYFAGDVDPDANDGLESPHKDVHDTITIQELGTVTHLLGQNAREAELLDKINPEDTSPMRREVKLAAAEKDGDLEETLRYSQEVTFEKVGVDVDAGMDDAKQLLLTSDADPAVVVKGELEHLVLDPVEISIHTDNTSIDSPNLDGVWILDKGEPVAVVRGSDVQLFGDGADFETLLQPLGAGVWSITIDDEEFLADCVEREDGTLLLQWSDGLTWERQKEGIVANHSVSTAETAERRDESQSASTSSSSSSSSSSCTSSPCSSRTSVSSVGPEEPSKPCQAGEVVELVQALESNAVGEPGEPGLVYQAEETGEASKAEEAGEVREPSKADKSGEAGEANEASRVGEAGKAGEVSEVGKAGAASKDWERLA